MNEYPVHFSSRGWQVPAFRTDILKPRATRYVTVIPVINEGERIRRQLLQMQSLGIMDQTDVAIIDGGSTDGSVERGFLQATGVRALVTKTGPGKLSAQLRCAYGWALAEGYEGIITIDGNGKDGVDTIPAFLAALEAGIDYAQASRFLPGGRAVNTPISRLLAIRLFHAPLLSLAAGTWLTDTTQGYRAYSARFLEDPRTQPFRDVFVGYELLAYLTVRSRQIGYRVKEIATSRTYPADEPTPTKIHGIGALWNLVMIAIRAALKRYHPKQSA